MTKFLSISLLTLLPFVVLAEDKTIQVEPTETTASKVASNLPQLVGAQVTIIDQHLYSLNSPYGTNLSLPADGDTATTYTYGIYLGWEPLTQIPHFQLYLDLEQFQGNGINGATGLADLTDGDSIRSGATNLPKDPYVARKYVRYFIPLSNSNHSVDRSQDQLSGTEPDERLEFKFGTMAVNDDFDKNRYANSTRTEFMNWGLFNATSWDFPANTRGYTTGLVTSWVSPQWAVHYGVYQMPVMANGQKLCSPITLCNGQNLEVDWMEPKENGFIVRVLGFTNIYNGGNYDQALLIAQQTNTLPNIQADDQPRRHKYGFVLNLEKPLFDGGDTGVFARASWNDGNNESFVFTEVDHMISFGGQLSGVHWGRPQDQFSVGTVIAGLSSEHEEYLAHGGEGFVLGDGKINYGQEEAIEAFYKFKPIKYIQISPDIQYIIHPGYNKDRGNATVVGLRVHLEY